MSSGATTSNDLNCAAGFRARRWRTLVLFLAALVLLALAVGLFAHFDRSNRDAQQQLEQARQTLAQAQRQQSLVQQQVALHEALEQLAGRAQALALAPAQWSQRRINLQDQTLTRMAADRLLGSTGRGAGHVFATRAFDLSVVRPGEGLFQLPGSDNRSLRLSMQGTAFFSTRGRP